jgi:hypothetical protein
MCCPVFAREFGRAVVFLFMVSLRCLVARIKAIGSNEASIVTGLQRASLVVSLPGGSQWSLEKDAARAVGLYGGGQNVEATIGLHVTMLADR